MMDIGEVVFYNENVLRVMSRVGHREQECFKRKATEQEAKRARAGRLEKKMVIYVKKGSSSL